MNVKGTTMCWRCNTRYLDEADKCPECGAFNGNHFPVLASAQGRLEQVKGFRTTDKEVFLDEGKALQWQMKLDFVEWYRARNEIDCEFRESPTAEGVFGWLQTHKEKLLEILS